MAGLFVCDDRRGADVHKWFDMRATRSVTGGDTLVAIRVRDGEREDKDCVDCSEEEASEEESGGVDERGGGRAAGGARVKRAVPVKAVDIQRANVSRGKGAANWLPCRRRHKGNVDVVAGHIWKFMQKVAGRALFQVSEVGTA